MNQVTAQEYIDALRSGEFRQNFGALCVEQEENHSFCALGVLYELIFRKNPEMSAWRTLAGDHLVRETLEAFDVFPRDIVTWSDKERLTFPEIADKLLKSMDMKLIRDHALL